MEKKIAQLIVKVYDDETMEVDFIGDASHIFDIFITLGRHDPEYQSGLAVACYTLMEEKGITLEQFVNDAVSKMN